MKLNFSLKPFSQFRKVPALNLLSAGPGELGISVDWPSDKEPIGIYRVRLTYRSPEGFLKESRVSLTFEPPCVRSFTQYFKLPKHLIEAFTGSDPAIVTIELLTTDNRTVMQDLSSAKVGAIYSKHRETGVEAIGVDLPEVATLDYQELIERRKKLKVLEEKAKAKAAPKVAPRVSPVSEGPTASL
jgi:hypothetical protein